MKIHACLAGEWVCLNDDPRCVIGEHRQSPDIWWEENAPIYSPIQKDKSHENSMYGLDYVWVSYKGRSFRINPIFIQIEE